MIAVLPLTLPLGIAAGTALAWWSWRRFADPPRLSPYPVRSGWLVDPMAWLDRDLRNERLASAINEVIGQLDQLIDRYDARPSQHIHDAFTGYPRARDSLVVEARLLRRRLERAWSFADLAEDPRLTDAWSRWRRPAWRAKARKKFEETFPEVRSIWPHLEAVR